ncbi:MAG TPA: hypothetical protein VHL11_14485 [Phototrophicaceae bacterium]|nr:hypothetical protein [Phototrophicaceae bacterium]
MTAILTLTLIGCGNQLLPTPTAIPETKSVWGRVLTIATTEHADAPAFQVEDGIVTFAWVGSDAAGVHQDVRILDEHGLSETIALPLSPIRPDRLTVINTGTGGSSLVFYLDANTKTDGETRLYSAAFGLNRTLIQGPTPISSTRTEAYTIIHAQDGKLWVIWSGGLPGEPTLYAQSIDALGRPQLPVILMSDVKFPTSGEDQTGNPIIYWLSPSTRQIYRARFVNGQLQDTTVLTDSIRLEVGERLVNFTAAQDTDYGYLFWNTVTVDGKAHTRYTSGLLTEQKWQAPVLFNITAGHSSDFVTGFNGGAAYSSHFPGSAPVTWVSPAQVQGDKVLLAGQIGSAFGVIYLQNGTVAAYQSVAHLDQPLIGLPAVATDIERHLYLAWSEPTPDDRAALRFTTTRPFN